MFTYSHVYAILHDVHAVSVQDRREHQVPLKLKLQVIVSCILWVLGVQPGTFVRAAKSFN